MDPKIDQQNDTPAETMHPAVSDQKPTSTKKRFLLVVMSFTLFVVLSIGLGAGLGLGLKHNGKSVSSSTSSPSPSPSAATTTTPQSWRRDPSEYILDMDSWDINAPPTTRHFDFKVSEIEGYPDGVLRSLYVVNGQYPAPLVRVNRGDRVLVNVTNGLSSAVTFHWHGLYQNGTNWMDGTAGITQCPIPPGTSFLYNFTVDMQYGTYWYHSHYKTQYMDGLFGPLIIHAPEEARYRKMYDHDQVVLLNDYYHNMSATYLDAYLGPGNENNEPVPDNGLIQGANYFNCSTLDPSHGHTCYQNSTRAQFNVQQNQRYRFRLINAGGFGMFQFAVDNHTLSVIEADSTMVEPLGVNRLDIAVAERYSVVLNANQSANNYWIRATMDTYCFTTSNPVLDTAGIRGILSYTNDTSDPVFGVSAEWPGEDPNVLCVDMNTTLLVPAEPQQAPKADLFFSLQFAFSIRENALDRAYINGSTWTPSDTPTLNVVVPALQAGNSTFNHTGVASGYGLSNQYIIDLPDYAVVDVLVTNYDDSSHPFHLHGHQFWVIASSEEQYFDYSAYESFNLTNPLRRDTVMVDSFGWTLIRFVNDNPGMWAFHCHITWHLEAGLLMQFQSRNDIMKDWTIPDDVRGLYVNLNGRIGSRGDAGPRLGARQLPRQFTLSATREAPSLQSILTDVSASSNNYGAAMTSANFAAAQRRVLERRRLLEAENRTRLADQQRASRVNPATLERLPYPLNRLSGSGLHAWNQIQGREGTRPQFRVGQVDAELLDEELLGLLNGQVGEALKYFGSHIRDDWSSEIQLALRALLFKISIWDHNASYGAALQGLQYVDSRSRSLIPPPPTKWQKSLYGLFTVGGRYAWEKWENWLIDRENGYEEPSGEVRLFSRITSLVSTTHSIAAFASFLVFLVNGRYRTLIDRILRIRLAPPSNQVSREVSFEYLNRQLVWHAFTEFLLFLLPLVGISRWRRWVSRAWKKAVTAMRVSDDSDIPSEKQGQLAFLPERTCAICYNEQNPAATSEADILGASSGGVIGSAQTDITNPYETIPCGCIYCFVCITERLEAEEGEGWICLRCGEIVKQCKPWNGDVLEEVPRQSLSGKVVGFAVADESVEAQPPKKTAFDMEHDEVDRPAHFEADDTLHGSNTWSTSEREAWDEENSNDEPAE